MAEQEEYKLPEISEEQIEKAAMPVGKRVNEDVSEETQYIELADELLQSGEDLNGVPLVQRNFIEGCMKGGQDGSESLISLANSCGCSYKALVAFVREVTISDIEAFKAFEAFDKQLKDEDGFANLDTRVKDIFSSCQS